MSISEILNDCIPPASRFDQHFTKVELKQQDWSKLIFITKPYEENITIVFMLALFMISHLNKGFEMRRMQLDVAVLQDFSAFLSSAAAGSLLFIFLGKHQLKLLHVKIFRFYKVRVFKPA